METIILATDFSQSAHNAAKYAAQLGVQLGVDRLILYHSFDILPTSADIPENMVLSEGKLAEQSQSFLQELKEELLVLTAKKMAILTIANSLNLERGINDLSEEYNASMVVIGLSGKNIWEKLLIGSSTKKLLSHCRLSLLIVPAQVDYQPIEKMVLACDLKAVYETVPIAKIRCLIESLKAQLLVVNVDHRENEHFSTDIIRQQYAFYDLFEDFYPSIHYVDNAAVDIGILEYTKQQQAQLIIAVAKKHTFFERIGKESVSKKLALKATVPLLILR